MPRDVVPLRDLLVAHHQATDKRLDRIEALLDGGHDHKDKVSWSAFVTTMLGIGAVLVPALIVIF